MVLLFFVLFVSSCSVDLRDDVLFVFFGGVDESSSVVSGNVSSSSGFRVLNTLPNFDLAVKEFVVFSVGDYFFGDGLVVVISASDGFSVLRDDSWVYLVGEVPGDWGGSISVFQGDLLVYSRDFFVFVSRLEDSSSFVNYEPPRRNLLDEFISFFRRGSRVEDVLVDVVVDEFCGLPRLLFDGEFSAVRGLRRLNATSDILNYVNNYFVFDGPGGLSMRSGYDVFRSDSGSDFEVLRFVSYALIINCYLQAYLVYEFESGDGVDYSAVLFVRDVDGLKYFYIDGGVLFLDSHSGRNNVLSMVEAREGIVILRYAYHPRDRIFEFWSRDVLDVSEWYSR